MGDTAPVLPKSWNAKRSLLQRMHYILSSVGYATRFIAPLLTRLIIGYAFYLTGSGKLKDIDKVTGFFEGLGIPAPHLNALFIAHLECYGGIALMLGLGTRIFAALLGSTMIVALLTADREAFMDALPWTKGKDLTEVTPLIYGTFLSWLLLYGPGFLSLDAIIYWG